MLASAEGGRSDMEEEDLQACLPEELRGAGTRIERIAAGLSGAGVFRIDVGGRAYVLKLAGDAEPLDEWRRKLHYRRLASTAGLAPELVHADEPHRATLTVFVEDRSLPALYADPRTRDTALSLLGRTLRRVHDLPAPPDTAGLDPRKFLAVLGAALADGPALPAFVSEAIRRMLVEEAPTRERSVLSHNDVNPTNLVYDGEHLLLLDWEVAGPNDPYYDLASLAVFLRMDDATCLRLLSIYEDAPITRLPARFAYSRRLVAVLCGAAFLHLARSGHYTGASTETLDGAPSLSDFYQRLQSGALHVGTPEGQWVFGLALIKASTAL